MTYKQLRYQVDCCCHSSNPQRAFEDIKQALYKTQLSDCDHPKTIWITSADTGTKYPISAPCGQCYHCRETKQNEWVTRMWHETKLNSKFAYFITLTYKPVFKISDIPERLFDAFWHFDSYNETGHNCWSPCLLRLEHLQYFIRNLRNDLAASGRDRSFTFYACGEYGKRYGRPHFHLILWTKDPVTTFDVTKAWSVRKGKKFMSSDPIGRIEVDDLNSNGTITKGDINIDGQAYSPAHAFKYVAKYVGKTEEFNHTRQMYFVSAMQKRFDLSFFNERVLKYYIKNYHEYVSFHYDDPLFRKEIENIVKNLCEPQPLDAAASTSKNKPYLYYDFLLPFRPFRTCTRAQGIGSVYAKSNIDTLAQGALRISDPDIQGLVFPSFYLRKVKEYKCGYEFKRRDTVSSSFSKGCRPLRLSDFYQLLENDPFNPRIESLRKDYVIPCDVDRLDQIQLSKLLNTHYAVRIAYTGERVLFTLRSSGLTDYLWCVFFKYSRVSRLYHKVRQIPFQQFYEEFEFRINQALDDNILQQKKAFESLRDRLYCEDVVNLFCEMNDLKTDYFNLVKDVQNIQDSERIAMSKINYDNFNRKDL